jgi:hypothetical protein
MTSLALPRIEIERSGQHRFKAISARRRWHGRRRTGMASTAQRCPRFGIAWPTTKTGFLRFGHRPDACPSHRLPLTQCRPSARTPAILRQDLRNAPRSAAARGGVARKWVPKCHGSAAIPREAFVAPKLSLRAFRLERPTEDLSQCGRQAASARSIRTEEAICYRHREAIAGLNSCPCGLPTF